MVDIEKMFDEISSSYDFLNNIISFFTHKRIKSFAIDSLNIFSGAKVLDLCTGSGDLGIIIKKKIKDVRVFGIDFSEKMLEIAKSKSKDIIYSKQNAEKLFFKDCSFDFVVMGFGFRNVEDKISCAREIFRVLKDGGKFLHLDFGRKNLASFFYNFIIILLAKIFSKKNSAYSYLVQSKNAFMEPSQLVSFFENNGFKFIYRKDLLFGIISFQILEK